jgi:hypothetical protein
LRHSQERAAIAAETGVRHLAFAAGLRTQPQGDATRRWLTPRWPVPVESPVLRGLEAGVVRRLDNTSVVILDSRTYTLQHATDKGVVVPMPSIDEALRLTTLPLTEMLPGSGGLIWLCNPNGQTVVVNMETWSATSVSRDGCYKVAPRPGGGAVLMKNPRSGYLFESVGTDGSTISKFGQVLQDQRHYAIALDGRIVDDAGTLIYVPNHLGFLAAFDLQGRWRYLMNGIEEDAPLPQVRIEPGRVAVDRPRSFWWQRDLVACDGFVVSLIARTVEGTEEAGLDIYEASTGRYIHSVRLPATSKGLALLPHGMYSIEPGGVSLRKLDWHDALALR